LRISSCNFSQGVDYAAVVLNFQFGAFEFVSNFVLSISDLCHCTYTFALFKGGSCGLPALQEEHTHQNDP
jgi:hypothetical protein